MEGVLRSGSFFCEVSEIIPQKDYLETDGPLICKGDLRQLVRKPTFSFFYARCRDAGNFGETCGDVRQTRPFSAMIENKELEGS